MKPTGETQSVCGRGQFQRERHDETDSFVISTRRVKEHTWPNGNRTPAHEAMPSSEQWGTYGWTCNTLERAKVRLRQIEGSTAKGGAADSNVVDNQETTN